MFFQFENKSQAQEAPTATERAVVREHSMKLPFSWTPRSAGAGTPTSIGIASCLALGSLELFLSGGGSPPKVFPLSKLRFSFRIYRVSTHGELRTLQPYQSFKQLCGSCLKPPLLEAMKTNENCQTYFWHQQKRSCSWIGARSTHFFLKAACANEIHRTFIFECPLTGSNLFLEEIKSQSKQNLLKFML